MKGQRRNVLKVVTKRVFLYIQSVCVYVPWLCVPSQIWSVSQTPTPVPANSPPMSTSLLKSWTWRSSPFLAAVGIWKSSNSQKGMLMCSGFVQSPLCFHWRRLSPPAERVVYNLYAVSNHSGNTLGGHYTAYCRHPTLGEWHFYNDAR